MRHYREAVNDPQLEQQIRGFIGQEGFHPNDIDQSSLIRRWQDDYPEIAAPQVGEQPKRDLGPASVPATNC